MASRGVKAMIEMNHIKNLSQAEVQIVTNWWLGGIEIDFVISAMLDEATAKHWNPVETAEKIVGIRTRYMELDMIEIQQEMALRFMPEEEMKDGKEKDNNSSGLSN